MSTSSSGKDTNVNTDQSVRSATLVLTIALATAAVFFAGVFTAQALNAGGVLPALAQMAQVVPGVYDVEDGQDIPAATNLTPIKTYWRARQRIIDHYVYPEELGDSTLTYGAVRGMLRALEDPYSRFMDPEQYSEFQTESEGHFEGIGAELTQDVESNDIIVANVLPDGPAAETALMPGDVIVAVDDTIVKDMDLTDVVKIIRGEEGTDVVLTVRHEDAAETTDVTITRARVDFPIIEHRMLEDDIGYVWLRSFNRMAAAELRDAIEDLKEQGMKGLLLDLSYDPGGMLDQAIAVASLFVDDTPVTYIRDRAGEPEPLPASSGTILDGDVPIVVLINRGSASASEIVAGALQDTGRGTIVGENSFGKAKVQTVIELDDGSAMVLTTAVYLTPDKRDISGGEGDERGIQPDVRFPEPPEDPEERPSAIDWHEQQVERASDVLKEKMQQAG